ncbi:ATP-binding protein [Microbacterium sp. No. 7]|uniref:ATP-binding protein n=1 Tax=Microbacterium sp. No. 7 TaxID=1714373 RepID=UPI000AE9C7F5|nr:LuxR C-terminal-related transcriptional regulator [Microbacterium sp. No. 7]
MIRLPWARFTGSFVGREPETALLAERMRLSRLVTLHGPAGIGKSRLAVEAVRRHVAEGGAAWYVDADSLERPGLLASSLAAAAGITSYPGDALTALCAYLAERRGLVVIDNCEHVIDECADVAATLLRHTSRCQVVVVSRTVLGLQIEHIVPVGPLPVGPAPAADGVGTAERLFLDRASAITPEIHGRECLAMVREICRRVGGNPLGIELAASRLRTLSLEELMQSIARPFTVLRPGTRTRVGRHGGLLESIQWSYGLCLPGQREAWRALSICQGDFGADLASSLLPGLARDEVLDVLQSLVEQAVLAPVTSEGRRRFHMPELVREFGRDELYAEEEDDRVCDRYLDWYATLGRELESGWLGPRQRELHAQAVTELPNIRSAIELALGRADQHERLLDIMVRPNPYLWWCAGMLEEGLHWFTRIEEYGTAVSELAYRCRGGTATYLAAIGAFDRAQDIADELTAVAATASDPREKAGSCFVSGFLAVMRRQWDRAEAQIAQGRGLMGAEAVADPLWFQLKQIEMYLLHATQRYDRAAASCHEMIDASDRFAETYYRSYALHGLAFHAWASSDVATADDRLRRALTLVRPFPNRPENPAMLFLAGLIELERGDDKRATVLISAAHGTARTAVSVWHPLSSPRAERTGLHGRLELLRAERPAEWRFGNAMNPEAAIDFALDRSGERLTADLDALLTERELQVAQLIALRRTNRQIADELVISVRTAEGHVEHIRRKLGVHSRKEVRELVAPAMIGGVRGDATRR